MKLKDELENGKLAFDKYIDDKGFRFQFNNNHYKEKYDIEIEVVNKTVYSSDSSSDSDTNSDNEKSSNIVDDFLYMNSHKSSYEVVNSKDKKLKTDQNSNKKNSFPSSDRKNSTKNKRNKKSEGKKKKKKTEPEGQMSLLSMLEEKPSDEGEFLTSYVADYRRIQDHG